MENAPEDFIFKSIKAAQGALIETPFSKAKSQFQVENMKRSAHKTVILAYTYNANYYE